MMKKTKKSMTFLIVERIKNENGPMEPSETEIRVRVEIEIIIILSLMS